MPYLCSGFKKYQQNLKRQNLKIEHISLKIPNLDYIEQILMFGKI